MCARCWPSRRQRLAQPPGSPSSKCKTASRSCKVCAALLCTPPARSPLCPTSTTQLCSCTPSPPPVLPSIALAFILTTSLPDQHNHSWALVPVPATRVVLHGPGPSLALLLAMSLPGCLLLEPRRGQHGSLAVNPEPYLPSPPPPPFPSCPLCPS